MSMGENVDMERIGIIWLGIGICGGPFDRVMSFKGPRNEGNFWFF